MMAIVCDICDKKHGSGGESLVLIDQMKFCLGIVKDAEFPSGGLERAGQQFRVDLCCDCRGKLAILLSHWLCKTEDAITQWIKEEARGD
jgi:hypothetical protein